ncbi:MAG: chemotaxis protein CheW, partial [Desulfofundulus sp.]
MLEQQVVTFHLNRELFGIELKYVQEVIRVPAVVAVPCTPSHFLGLSNLRGEILPVVDGRIRVGTPSGDISESARVVVISREGGKVGFLVDRVSEVVDLEGAEIEEINSDTRAGCVHRAIRFP